jgi:aryl-alcohol dehydrogenase-like predicted oxidoreductase
MSAHSSVAPRAEGGKPAVEAKGVTPAQVALAWLLAFDNLVFTDVYVRAAGVRNRVAVHFSRGQ